MAAGAWTFPDAAKTSILNGDFDFDTDTFNLALHLSTGTQPSSSTTTWAGLATSEHAAANGYTAGGQAITLSRSGGATVTCDGSDEVWTASGGSIVARWGVIYEVSGNVVCYCLLDDTPADVTATSGNTLTVAISASGVFSLT